jgi:hypothetical protein
MLCRLVDLQILFADIRQLADHVPLCSFCRVTKDVQQMAWRHPHFARHDVGQLQHIVRTAIKRKTKFPLAMTAKKILEKKAAQDNIILVPAFVAPSQPTSNEVTTRVGFDAGLRGLGLGHMNMSIRAPVSFRPSIIDYTLQQTHASYAHYTPFWMHASSVVSLEDQNGNVLPSKFIQTEPIGSSFNETMPQFKRGVNTNLASCKNDGVDISCEAREEEWLHSWNDLGIGNDSYVAEPEHVRLSEKSEDAKSNELCAHEDNTIGDVSNIDFNEFMSKFFPSEAGC